MYFRFFGVLFCLMGINGIWPVLGQTQPSSTTGGTGGLPAGISVRRPCAQPPSLLGGEQCKEEPTTFRDATPGVKSWVWTFNDAPLSGTATGGTSTSTTSYSIVQNAYTSTGPKTVTLTRIFSNSATPPESITFNVTIYNGPQPFQQWRRDTTICKGQTIELNPYPNVPQSGLTYEWASKGETTQSISVTGSGCYSVEATNVFGCSYEDKIEVKVCPDQPQQQGAKWYFGNNAGIEFQGGSASPLTDGKLNTIEGSSSINDAKGNVLFYTDGVKIYDKDGNLMGAVQYDAAGKIVVDPATGKPLITTAVTSLGGSQISTQSALIVPKGTCQGCEYQYYVYTTAEINGTRQLTYSIVDMRKNDGKGAVVESNLPVAGTSTTALSTERSAGVKNEQDSTYWVITRDFGSNIFRITHLTKNATPSQTTVALGASQTATAQGEGYLKIGPAPQSSTVSSGTSTTGTSGTATNPGSNTADGVERPVAMMVPGIPPSPVNPGTNNSVELYTFNDKTGKLEYKRAIDLGPSPPRAYGVEFSPDGKSLYVSLVGDPANSTAVSSYILRYDLTITDPDQLSLARTEIATSTTQQFGALQIGPDGRIYVSIPGQSSLGVIENPNASFLDSLRFTFNGQTLGGKTGQLGLPNQIANFNQPPSNGAGLSHEGICLGEPTTFSIGPYCPDLKERYTVNFGDGTQPYSGTATQVPPHTYAKPGSYTATLTVETFQKGPNNTFGPSCTVVTATDALTIVAYPQSITLADQTVCRIPLSTTLSIDVAAQNYAWVFAGRVVGRGKTFAATRNGTYTAYAFNESPECAVKDDANVLFRQPFQLNVVPEAVVCEGSSTTIGVVGSPAYNTFQWSSGQNTKVISVTQAGTYSLTATHPIPGTNDGSVCTNTGVVSVSARTNPTVTASLRGPVSCTSLDGAITLTPNQSNTLSYAWTGANNAPLSATGNSLSGVSEGAYAVRVTDEFSCSSTASYTLKSPVNNLALIPTASTQLCSVPGSGRISLNVTGGRLPFTYFWRDAANTLISSASVLTGINSGSYTAAVSDVNGCTAILSRIPVGLNPTGFADLGPPQDKCPGNALLLRPVSSTLAGNVYQWSNGQSTPTISVTGAGTYSVQISNPNGCTGAASVQINDRPAPAVTLAPEYRFCVGDNQSTTLTAGGPSSLSFVWSRANETSRTLPVNAVGSYSVRATDPVGCTALVSTRVIDFCEPRVFIPEAFTPNGDGQNDLLDVYSSYTSGFEIRIFNRWGEVIFVSNEPENVKWDGTYRGQVYPPMMYAYVISYGSEYDPEKPRVVRRGSVLLIR